eukprot:1148179-Pelagomonas_calceolata.AAC.3
MWKHDAFKASFMHEAPAACTACPSLEPPHPTKKPLSPLSRNLPTKSSHPKEAVSSYVVA